MAVPWTGSRLAGCALYFFLFASFGSLTPFLPLIWRSKGLAETEVGLLAAVRPISVILAGQSSARSQTSTASNRWRCTCCYFCSPSPAQPCCLRVAFLLWLRWRYRLPFPEVQL
ncbi:unnamed protein product [Ectocarpus sp. 12 AP-2014]